VKAVRIHQHGNAAQLRCEDCPIPTPRDDEVLINLKAAGVNRIDAELHEHYLPRIPGVDGAGLVQSVGAHVHEIRRGDAVCLFPFQDCRFCAACVNAGESPCRQSHLVGPGAAGTYAEFICVPARNCFPVPAGFSFEEAAALPLVHLMAWRMLVSDAALKPGEWVMIVGAGGGIATAALQLATAFGARAIVLSRSEQKFSAALRLGAMHVVSLSEPEPFRAVRALTGKRGVDVAVNCVGSDTWAGSLAALARGGRLVTCGAVGGNAPRSDVRRIFWNHLKILGAQTATREEFTRLLNFFAAKRRKPVIDRVFPLCEADRAHEFLERGRQFGKLVLRIGQ
jgi:NADPH:quinone reductase-like Zn-dependent oxidoreductase